MKKLFGLLLPLALFSFGAIADGADAEIIVREENLERPVGEVKNVRQLLDEKGIYYAVDVNFSVLPIGAGVAVGYSHEEKVEAEVYAAITAIRLVSESAPHIPYGARVRVALNERKTKQDYIFYSYC